MDFKKFFKLGIKLFLFLFLLIPIRFQFITIGRDGLLCWFLMLYTFSKGSTPFNLKHESIYIPAVCTSNQVTCFNTWILQDPTYVLLKYFKAASASSSVLKPMKPKWRKLPCLSYFNWTSVILPFWLNVSRNF